MALASASVICWKPPLPRLRLAVAQVAGHDEEQVGADALQLAGDQVLDALRPPTAG